MEKENITENETKEEMTLNEKDSRESKVNEINTEIEELVSNGKKSDEENSSSTGKEIMANILDELLLAAISSVLVVIVDFCLNAAGYRFVRDNGSIIGAAAIIFFIMNCIYAPLMAKTKAKKTIAKKILSI